MRHRLDCLRDGQPRSLHARHGRILDRGDIDLARPRRLLLLRGNRLDGRDERGGRHWLGRDQLSRDGIVDRRGVTLAVGTPDALARLIAGDARRVALAVLFQALGALAAASPPVGPALDVDLLVKGRRLLHEDAGPRNVDDVLVLVRVLARFARA